MVRFNDKTAITSQQISSDDILPITDLSASSDDKKISLGQIGDFVADNADVAHKDLDNTNMITDAIFEAPNGIFVASDDDTSIIIKNGLRLLIADGRDDDKKIETIDYSVASDITQSIITLADGEYSLFVTADDSIVYTNIDNVFISRTQPNIPESISIAYWYDVQANYWKTTNNQGSTWTNQSIGQLGFFVIEDGLVTELKPNTLVYIPNSEYIMVRDLSNITDNGRKLIQEEIATAIADKQDILVSGTNIKTINSASVLGEGDMLISIREPLESMSALSNSTINLQSDISIYSKIVSENITFTFNTTNLGDLTDKSVTFELYLTMNTAYTLTFPNSVSWIEEPDFSNTGKYLLVFKSLDGGTSWLGNLEAQW